MKVFLLEALLPKQTKIVDTWPERHHHFSDHAMGMASRITIPLEHPEKESEHHTAIHKHLEQHGYRIMDYKKGHAIDKFNRPTTIGRALVKTKAPELLARFNTDPSRQQQSANEDYHVVISRHPHDVAGMTSAGHSWENESCMNFSSGSNRHFLKNDVAHGTHVAYLVHKDDHEIQHPVARIALKPFHGQHISVPGEKYTHVPGEKYTHEPDDIILRPENKTYGNAPDAFSHTVNRWVNKHFPGDPSRYYHQNRNLYADSGIRTIIGNDAWGKILKHHSARNPIIHDNDWRHLETTPGLDPAHISKALEVAGVDGIHGLHNPAATSAHVDQAIEMISKPETGTQKFGYHHGLSIMDSHATTHEQVGKVMDVMRSKGIPMHSYVGHEKIKGSNLDKAFDWLADSHDHRSDTTNLANNPNLEHRHIDKLLHSDLPVGGYVEKDLASSAKLSDKHIEELSNRNHDARLSINPHMPKSKVEEFIKHPDSLVRRSVASRKDLDTKHVHMLMEDPDPSVHYEVASKYPKKLSDAHVGKIISSMEANPQGVGVGLHQINYQSFFRDANIKPHFDRILSGMASDPKNDAFHQVLRPLVERKNLADHEVDKIVDTITQHPAPARRDSYILSDVVHALHDGKYLKPHHYDKLVSWPNAEGAMLRSSLATFHDLPHSAWEKLLPNSDKARTHPVHGEPTYDY